MRVAAQQRVDRAGHPTDERDLGNDPLADGDLTERGDLARRENQWLIFPAEE